MPRPKKEGAGEPKKRSRTGCWPCKARKVKCGEEKPTCQNCVKAGETCDYSIRLNWGGRSRKDKDANGADPGGFTFVATPSPTAAAVATSPRTGGGHEHVFSAQRIVTSAPASQQRPSSNNGRKSFPPTPDVTPSGDAVAAHLDPRLRLAQQQFQFQQPPAQPPRPLDENGQRRPASLQHTQSLPHFTTLLEHGQAERSPPTSTPNDFSWSPQHRNKRAKLSPRASPIANHQSPVFAVPQYPAQTEHTPGSNYFTPHSINSIVNTPATPGSSVNSGSPYPGPAATPVSHEHPDLRRLSVKSLLSDPSDITEYTWSSSDSRRLRTYGYDHGLPDLDIPRNNDMAAIGPRSPDLRRTSAAVSEVSSDSDMDPKQIAFEPGGYYAQPVAIKIPRALEPLPRELTDNPINMLYFHHFLNHTARIMVPHDCPENPLRGVLPQMAVRNNHLLHLLLAFSASHRSRLLGHPEPANRIAEWMSDVLPALRQALNEPSSQVVSDPADPSSLAPLATAIMLASLEIISPNTFAVPISWQNHLHVARQMIVATGGLHHLAQKANGARDKAIFFLSRWFAYLDVLGSLSGSRHDQPLYGAYLEDGGGLWLVNRDDEEIFKIDCFFGFSGRCIALLAAVAELAADCDKERIDPSTRQPRPEWRPSEAVERKARELQNRLIASASCVYRGCMHSAPGDSPSLTYRDMSERDIAEIFATNEASHWAGMIHISRRVLNLPHSHPDVQDCVAKVIENLSKVRRGSSAESCLLFAMFTAGCEAQTEADRAIFENRLEAVEGWGMCHVKRARKLMHRVWESGGSWEGVVEGEFFG
ncbi:hypothetical protein Q7P35_011661 [Cladosporium inversicolor]